VRVSRIGRRKGLYGGGVSCCFEVELGGVFLMRCGYLLLSLAWRADVMILIPYASPPM
jgi:hypothetical protein